jgi:alkylhydroperoxidase family enzyme
MARVPLVPPEDWPEGTEDLAERVRGARRGNVINIYRMLIHSPKMVEGWLDWFNAVRWGTSLPGRLRELVIIRIAHVTKSAYALRQHVPKLAAADGVSQAECDALAGDYEAAGFFSAAELAALAYADAMVATRTVPDAIHAELHRHYDDRETVELTILVATYLLHGHVMQALEIDLEPAS